MLPRGPTCSTCKASTPSVGTSRMMARYWPILKRWHPLQSPAIAVTFGSWRGSAADARSAMAAFTWSFRSAGIRRRYRTALRW
jgi:hypothetical protein